MDNEYNNGYDPNAAYDANAGYDANTAYNAEPGFDANANGSSDNNTFTAEPVNAPAGEKPVLAIVALACGIASIVLSCCCCGSLPCSIAALICGIICKTKHKPNEQMGLIGAIIGGAGIVVSAILTLIIFILNNN